MGGVGGTVANNWGMHSELRTIADCPNDAAAHALFRQVLECEDIDAGLPTVREIERDAEAVALNFHGSPTFAIDGVGLFPAAAEPALTCRVYPTDGGLKGRPSLHALRKTVRPALERAAG